MLERTITIDGKPVKFRASAAVPRMYMALTGSDIFSDIGTLAEQFHPPKPEEDAQQETDGQQKPTVDLKDLAKMSVFENIAYIMAKHADAAIPASPDEWLEQFNTFSIYEILPQLIDLWGLNVETQVKSKKNIARLTDR